jgi:hypothetical protein
MSRPAASTRARARAQVVVTLAFESTLTAEAEKLANEVQIVEWYSRDVRHSLAGLSRFWLAAGQQRAIQFGEAATQVLMGQSVRDAEP